MGNVYCSVGGGTADALSTSQVVNNLTTTDEGYVLDARQGSALKTLVDSKVNTSAVVNNLTTTSSGYVADARALKTLNDSKVNTSVVVNNLTTTASGYVADARALKTLNDSKVNTSVVVNNLTTTSSGYVADARALKTLNDSKLATTAVVNNFTTTASGYAADARALKTLYDLTSVKAYSLGTNDIVAYAKSCMTNRPNACHFFTYSNGAGNIPISGYAGTGFVLGGSTLYYVIVCFPLISSEPAVYIKVITNNGTVYGWYKA